MWTEDFTILMIDPKNPKLGIQEMRKVDPTAIRKVKEITTKQDKTTGVQTEEVTAEYKTLRSELESRLQQSRVESATAFLGLEQPMEPPVLLEVDVK